MTRSQLDTNVALSHSLLAEKSCRRVLAAVHATWAACQGASEDVLLNVDPCLGGLRPLLAGDMVVAASSLTTAAGGTEHDTKHPHQVSSSVLADVCKHQSTSLSLLRTGHAVQSVMVSRATRSVSRTA